jgi:hypothetical protein
MITLAELEAQIMALPDEDRAKLASRLIESLQPEFDDEADYREAIRRDREMDEDPSASLTMEEFKRAVGR